MKYFKVCGRSKSKLLRLKWDFMQSESCARLLGHNI